MRSCSLSIAILLRLLLQSKFVLFLNELSIRGHQHIWEANVSLNYYVKLMYCQYLRRCSHYIKVILEKSNVYFGKVFYTCHMPYGVSCDQRPNWPVGWI